MSDRKCGDPLRLNVEPPPKRSLKPGRGWWPTPPYVRTNIGWQVRVRNGAFAFPYQISVYRDHSPATNALLRSLELSNITLNPTFDGRTQMYTATTAAREVTVTATPLDPDATAVSKLNGTPPSGTNHPPTTKGPHQLRKDHTNYERTTPTTHTCRCP